MAEEYNLSLRRELDEAKATALASAATVNIGWMDGNTVNITGTTTITSFGAPQQAGVRRNIIFDGILTLTHSSSLQLPGATNIITAAGDVAIFVADTETTWKCMAYTRASIAPTSGILMTSDPVDGVQATVTVDMTNANADMTYTAVSYGTAGNSITVTHTDPSGNDEALAVTVSGTDIDVSLATNGSGTITSTAAEVKAAVNNHAAASLLVTAEDEGAGAGVVEAKTSESLSGGVDVTAGGVWSTHLDSSGTVLYVKVGAQEWEKVPFVTSLASAPVSGVKATVTVDMTNANADMTYTAVSYGTAGNSITVTHTDPSDVSQSLAVTVSGTDIDVSLATDGAGAITSTAAEVKAAVNIHAAAALLVLAEDEGAGAGVVEAKAEESLAGGVDVTAGAVLSHHIKSDGSLMYVKVSEQVWKQITLDALA